MDMKDEKDKLIDWLSKVEEPSVLYKISQIKEESEKKPDFDFDKEWENGYTLEEAKAISIQKINEWWGK